MDNYINKPIPLSECRRMMVDMLEDIDRFCTKHNISYQLTYGTLIGAVRHKGFIPWDDDVDIWMPRPDYSYFMEHYRHEYYKLLSVDSDDDYPLDYAKLHDSRTVVEETAGDGRWGLFIDIFILDGMPSKDEGERMFDTTARMRRVVANQRFTYKLKPSLRAPLSKNAAIIIGRILHPFISVHNVLKRMDNNNRRYSYDNCEYCGDLANRKRVFLKTDLQKTIRALFEGREFNIPAEYDFILRRIYGEYLQLPPEEKRVSNHGLKAFWKEQ